MREAAHPEIIPLRRELYTARRNTLRKPNQDTRGETAPENLTIAAEPNLPSQPDLPGRREEIITILTAQIANGTYEVTSKDLADKLIRTMRGDH
jgi:anti-sigma28 factor (negative regulator of flagellin synthesis)